MDSPIVFLAPETALRGKVEDGSRPVYTFQGVPYATPPTGKLRFKPPHPLPLWKGERDATKFGPVAYQNAKKSTKMFHPFPFPSKMSENCLYLNIWTPHLPTQRPGNQRSGQTKSGTHRYLPVIVWIHGGILMSGFSNMYQGTELCQKNDIIFISLNYRLGGLGFLTTGDAVMPGNCGLLDQVEALRWVQKYIAYFGGDTGNVTIAGQSAGAMCVDLHTLSDMSRGLFRRAIGHGGSILYKKSVKSPQYLATRLQDKVSELGCDSTKSADILDFLQAMDPYEVQKRFASTIELAVDGVFLKDKPEKLYQENKFNPIDYMLGLSSDDGFLSSRVAESFMGSSENIDAEQLEYILLYLLSYGYDNAEKITKLSLDRYRSSGAEKQDNLQILARIYQDNFLHVPILMAAEKRSALSKTYLYVLEHRPNAMANHRPAWVKSDHDDILVYVFRKEFNGFSAKHFTQRENQLREHLIKYWVNFATCGNPNGNELNVWPQYSPNKKLHLVLNDRPHVASDFNLGSYRFWTHTVEAMEELRSVKSKY